MTFFLFAIGLVLVGVSGRLAVLAIVIPRMRLKTHLREVLDYGFESSAADLVDLSFGEQLRRTLRSTAERVGRYAMHRFPSIKALKANELAAAGFYDVTPEAVHGYRILGAISLPLMIILLLLGTGHFSGVSLLLVFGAGAIGSIIPSFLIRKKGAARMDEIDRSLPELIDLLIATVEAGMGFAASLSLLAERFHGPLGDELRLTMKQQTLGMSIQRALADMGERCETPSVRAFIRTVSRGESLGVSIGPVLRELSGEQRRRRRQGAREKMQKAPVKMIFPLMFLIMPALMVVLMYPAAYSLLHTSGL
jgi:tight adherence protein C